MNKMSPREVRKWESKFDRIEELLLELLSKDIKKPGRPKKDKIEK